jgi:hypothetical protein
MKTHSRLPQRLSWTPTHAPLDADPLRAHNPTPRLALPTGFRSGLLRTV